MTISIDVARMEDEIRFMQSKCDSDERMISLLKEQNEQLAREMEQLTTKCAEATRRLSQERDEAVRRATEVSGILNQTAEMVMSSLRKMKGDETPPPPQIEVQNLTQIGKMDHASDEDDETVRGILHRLPMNEFERKS